MNVCHLIQVRVGSRLGSVLLDGSLFAVHIELINKNLTTDFCCCFVKYEKLTNKKSVKLV